MFRRRFVHGFVAGALLLSGWNSPAKERQHIMGSLTSKAQGVLAPPNAELGVVESLLQQNSLDQAFQALSRVSPKNEYEEAWLHYLRGWIHFERKEFDEGLAAFLAPYNRFRSAPDGATDEYFRLVGKCLKKVGWYYRNKKESDRAYAYHSIEYQYLSRFGSPEEIHDAAISLDVDAYFMGDSVLSEMWLRESIAVAERIEEERARSSALGMSWNNLAGTLTQLRRFSEAEIAIRTSLGHWEKFEFLTGTSGFRVAWAYFGIGDVYETWYKATPSKEKLGWALDAYSKSLYIAQAQKMPAEEIQIIQKKVSELQTLLRE